MGIFTEDYSNEEVILGGGCFWCTEAVFKLLKGVTSVDPGYAGGHKDNPTYEEVSTGTTGHAEVVRIAYNPSKISFEDILTVFFATHNPTTVNKQGDDVGEQYRSIILCTTKDQEKRARRFIDKLNLSTERGENIVTHVGMLETFFMAEKGLRNYYKNFPTFAYCENVINPKLEKVKKEFPKLLHENK